MRFPGCAKASSPCFCVRMGVLVTGFCGAADVPGYSMRPWAAAFLLVLLVAPRVFRAPEAPAAREARRPHFVRRRASKPARALRSLRRPPHLWGLLC